MSKSEIRVPAEIPDDEIVLVTAIHVPSKSSVKSGDAIFEIETSKTSYVISSDHSGILEHDLKLGDELNSGQLLGTVENDI